jgi:hypothetical protein
LIIVFQLGGEKAEENGPPTMKIPLQHPQNLRPADIQLGQTTKTRQKLYQKFVKLTGHTDLCLQQFDKFEYEEHEMTGNGSNANLLKLFFKVVKSHKGNFISAGFRHFLSLCDSARRAR